MLKNFVWRFVKGRWASLLGDGIRAIADGKAGEKPKAIYWWLAGKKTPTGLAIGAATAAVEYLVKAPPDYAWEQPTLTVFYTIASILVTAGLADGLTREEPPQG